MKYGILGDIHANLSALEAALSAFREEGVDHVISVGDVVGYGAAPRECIDLVRSVKATVVKGNHDAACVDEIDVAYFNNYAREAVAWTQAALTREETHWLAGLPMTALLDHCCVSHGTFHDPEHFNYLQSTTDADPSLDLMELPVCFVGHTHVPVALLRMHDDPLRTAYTVDAVVDLSDAYRALINVGSVGQPRDEDPRAAYALFDTKESTISIKRIEYDIELEAARIRNAGLPTVLADRLFLGV
jgi:predicted phosphodiesterase